MTCQKGGLTEATSPPLLVNVWLHCSTLALIVLALPEPGIPERVPEDLAPPLRRCEGGDLSACTRVADMAKAYGHPKLEDELRLRACRGGRWAQCKTPVLRCSAGDAAACRDLDARGNLVRLATPAPALSVRCKANDTSACKYLEETGLHSVAIVPVYWGPVKDGHGHLLSYYMYPSPDGALVLQALTYNGLLYRHQGKVAAAIEVPVGYSLQSRTPYLWTETMLWLPLTWSDNDNHAVGFYLDGRHVPLPQSWRVDRGPKERCHRVNRAGQVAFQQCFPDGNDRGPSRIFRASLDGLAYATFELTEGGKVLGAGHEPGSLWVRTYETLLARIDPDETRLGKRPPRRKPEVSKVLKDDGQTLLFHSAREVGVLNLRTQELRWLEANSKDGLQPMIVAATGDAWLRRREIYRGKTKVEEFRLATRDGYRSQWFRADPLGGSRALTDALPGGFFFRGSERGLYVRSPKAPPPGPGLAPTGRMIDPQPLSAAAWPPLPKKPAHRWGEARGWGRGSFEADSSGWPKLGKALAPDAPTELRPWSRHLQHFAGLEQALERCNDGAFEACEAARARWHHDAMPRRLRGVLGWLSCDHYVPSRCKDDKERYQIGRWKRPSRPSDRGLRGQLAHTSDAAMEALLTDGRGLVELVPPSREATLVRGLSLGRPKKPILRRQEDPFLLAVQPGRWRFEVQKEDPGEVWWAEVEVVEGQRHRVKLNGRSRRVQLTFLDRMGWPAGQPGTDLTGREPPRWLPITEVELQLSARETVRLDIPAGEGTHQARIVVEDPPHRRE